MVGRPGNSARMPAAADAIISGLAFDPSWEASLPCILPSMAPLDTTMPAAVETSRAGICETSPSPTVRVVKVASALSDRHMGAEQTHRQAAENVDQRDDQRADRVAANEFAGAVHGAVEAAFLGQFGCGAVRAVGSSIVPEDRSASIAICLPGMESR